MTVIAPPSTIGMLGGGQLGRFALAAAADMGYGTIVLDPDPHAPAASIADHHLVAPYDDPEALAHLAAHCAVVTTEFENPPASALTFLAERTVVRPDPSAVAIAQDRRAEKRFLREAGLPIGRYAVIDRHEHLDHATMAVRFPAVMKTARLGYDGKGQSLVASSDELTDTWEQLGAVPCVLEERLLLDAEVSVVLARDVDGHVAAWPAVENHHVNGILDHSVVPGRVDPTVVMEAAALAGRVADGLDYVGVLAVEMFVVGGRLLVNELAPRPHNSGHWTLDASSTSQFAQQVLAVCGRPLGDPAMTTPAAAMVNLLGDLWPEGGEPDWSQVNDEVDVHLHLYGKRDARPGRKMGHLTVLGDDPSECAERALALRTRLRVNATG